MPMKDPSDAPAGSAFKLPAEIQPNAMFVGTFVHVECKPYSGPPKYSKDGELVQQWSIIWHFTLRNHDTLQRVLNADGTPFEMWRFTSDATGIGSRGREVMHALAGREVSNAEVSSLLAADPEHMPTKLYGRQALLIMGAYTDSNNRARVGINQIVALSASDRARLEAARNAEASQPTPATPSTEVASMGPPRPLQQFDQKGREVASPPPQPVAQVAGARADGSAELPW